MIPSTLYSFMKKSRLSFMKFQEKAHDILYGVSRKVFGIILYGVSRKVYDTRYGVSKKSL